MAGQAGRNGEVKNKRRTWRPLGRAVLIMDIVVDIADEVVAVGGTEGEAATAEMANQVRGVDVVDIEVAETQQSCSKFSPIASNSQDGVRLFLRCTKKALLDEFSTSVSCGFKNSFLLSGFSGHFSLHSLETLLEKWVAVAHVCVSFPFSLRTCITRITDVKQDEKITRI